MPLVTLPSNTVLGYVYPHFTDEETNGLPQVIQPLLPEGLVNLTEEVLLLHLHLRQH